MAKSTEVKSEQSEQTGPDWETMYKSLDQEFDKRTQELEIAKKNLQSCQKSYDLLYQAVIGIQRDIEQGKMFEAGYKINSLEKDLADYYNTLNKAIMPKQ